METASLKAAPVDWKTFAYYQDSRVMGSVFHDGRSNKLCNRAHEEAVREKRAGRAGVGALLEECSVSLERMERSLNAHNMHSEMMTAEASHAKIDLENIEKRLPEEVVVKACARHIIRGIGTRTRMGKLLSGLYEELVYKSAWKQHL